MKQLALLAPVLILTACGEGHPKACKAPPDAKARAVAASSAPAEGYANSVATGQPGYNVQEAKSASEDARACVQRQAWALSKAKDSTDLVADAAVTACDEVIARSAQAEAANYGGDFQKPYDLDVKAMGRWARLYVIQYRSGQCPD